MGLKVTPWVWGHPTGAVPLRSPCGSGSSTTGLESPVSAVGLRFTLWVWGQPGGAMGLGSHLRTASSASGFGGGSRKQTEGTKASLPPVPCTRQRCPCAWLSRVQASPLCTVICGGIRVNSLPAVPSRTFQSPQYTPKSPSDSNAFQCPSGAPQNPPLSTQCSAELPNALWSPAVASRPPPELPNALSVPLPSPPAAPGAPLTSICL